MNTPDTILKMIYYSYKTPSSHVCHCTALLVLKGRSALHREMIHFIDISRLAYVFFVSLFVI